MSRPHLSAPNVHRGTIDVCLTDLERVSRRISFFVTSLKDEVHVFERLFYKSKNQQHSALFWRKVVEARRASQRLLCSRGLIAVDRLRASFHEKINASSQSIQEGHRKHAPLRRFMASSMHAIYELYMLLNKAIDVFESAYKSFELQFKSTKIKSLTLTLIAIVSRMNMLCVELKDSFEIIWSHFMLLSHVLQCDYHGPTKLPTSCKLVSVGEPDPLSTPHPVVLPDPVMLGEDDEDMGNVVSTIQTEGPHTLNAFIPAEADAALGEERDTTVQLSPATEMELRQTPSLRNPSSPQPDLGNQSAPLQHKGPEIQQAGPYGPPIEETAPKQTKKLRTRKRRRRDEIDDIFGTLYSRSNAFVTTITSLLSTRRLKGDMQGHFRTPDIPGTITAPEHTHQLRELVASLCRIEHTRFPGSQPVSFKTSDIERLHKEDYWVCEKSDGVRVLMLIVAVGPAQEVYLIDRKNTYRLVPNLYFPHYGDKTRPLGHTLLDGELVLDIDPNTKHETHRFLAFDCLVCDNTNVMDKILEKRYGRLMGFVIGPHQKMLKEFPDMVRTRPFDIQVKNMDLSYAVEKVLKEDIPRLQHGADGLIYTCVDSPYVVGTDPKLLKWKEPSQNSIDFKLELRFPSLHGRPQEPDYGVKPAFVLHAFHGERRGSAHYEFFDLMEVDDDAWEKMKASGEQYDDRLVEVAWNIKDQNWTFLRFRDDKDSGNHISVIQNIIASIRDGVESPELIKSAAAVKTAWKARASTKSNVHLLPPQPPAPPPSSDDKPNGHAGPIYSKVGGPLRASGFVR